MTKRTIGELMNTRTANEQFCKSWGEVQNSTFVLLFRSSTKFSFSASISQPSQSCRTLNKPYVYLHDNQVNIIQFGIVFA